MSRKKQSKKDKPKLTKEERRYLRHRKGMEWLLSNSNWKKPHLLSRYRKHMCLTMEAAAKDLEDLGVRYSGGDEKQFQRNQDCFRYALFEKYYEGIVETSDDTFSFIADFTSGGAAFGVTWEEAGIDPDLPYEEKVMRYGESLGISRMEDLQEPSEK